MSKYQSYLNSAIQILKLYKGDEPFASFIKKYFSGNKKYGSKDRKQISHLCYCFFRLGKTTINLPVEERILAGLFLCSDEPNEILSALKPVWNEKIQLRGEEKLLIINPPAGRAGHSLLIKDVFPWVNELSEGMDHEKFCESFLTQPDLFIRIRPHHAKQVLLKLSKTGTAYEFISPFTLRLPNSFKAGEHFELDKEVVIQDYSSQRVAEFLPVRPGRSDRVWDCCAGSGGKSIMVYDLNPEIELTVSDVRESILVNLKKRFKRAGIKNYKCFLSNLSLAKSKIENLQSEVIIADVPCTGSGTWSRTPEQLYFFNHQTIGQFNHLQRQIVSNVIPHLQPGGTFIYITCSVFKKENEEVVDFIKQEFPLQLKEMELLKGYDKKADSMFVAVFRNAE